MDHRRQRPAGAETSKDTAIIAQKKTAGLSEEFEALFAGTRAAFSQERTFLRARTLAISSLVGLGRRTVSGMLCTSAQQFTDWSAAYRLFAHERFDRESLFEPVKSAVLESLAPEEPLVMLMDDTLIRKRGRKVHGTAWRRDPLGPPFSINFIWGQRFLQLSAALPDRRCMGRACAVPVDFIHAPTAEKPKRNAPPQAWDAYRQRQSVTRISAVGAYALYNTRHHLDTQGQVRHLICAVDGGFTNRTVFRAIPENTTLIGRIRKDAKLFTPPDEHVGTRRGRPRWYGAALPTPEHIRQDDSIPWKKVEAFAAGTRHTFEVKSMPAVRWAGTGNRTVHVLIIRPLAYRPRKGARLLYRDPVYLLCSDPALPLSQLLQSYLWRWEIELNFRDEKTLLGIGQAQVRTVASVEKVPSLVVAAYAMLLLAGTSVSDSSKILPRPKWQRPQVTERFTTQQLIGLLRSQLWEKAMMVNLRHFASTARQARTPLNFENSLASAVCYATN